MPGYRNSPSAAAGRTVAFLSLGTVLNPLNSSMIAVALVMLRRDFGLDVATVTWVITVFYLASAAGQPLMGRLADRFGPRRMFCLGMALVAVSCALAPLTGNFLLVCVARVLMALGTATAFPSAVIMIRALTTLAGISSTRPLARIQMANTTGTAIGPVLGGVLVSTLGWQALFAVNVPLALLALAGVWWVVAPADPPREQGSVSQLIRASDIPGIVAFLLTLVLLILGLLDAVPGYRWLVLGAAPLAAGLFAWRELRAPRPFVDLRLLGGNRPLLLIYAVFAVFSGVYYVAFFGLPQFLEESAGYSPGVVGLMMLPLAAVSVLATELAGRVLDRFGVRPVLLVGVCGLLLSSALLLLLAIGSPLWLVMLLTAAMGLPYGVVSIASSQAMYASADPADAGVAAGILQTCRYLGAISATVLIGVMFTPEVGPGPWLSLVVSMLLLGVLSLVLSLLWRQRPLAP